MPDLSDAISDNASGPKKAQGDQGGMEQHPLPDQIAADKYLKSQTASQATSFGIRRMKMEAPGSV